MKYRKIMETKQECNWVCPLGTHSECPGSENIIFCVLLLIYTASCKNHSNVLTVGVHIQPLDAPMYFFSWLLIIYGYCLFYYSHPKYDHRFTLWKETISFQACMTQLFIGHLFQENRFTPGGHGLWPLCAICKPLHYLTIMSQRVCVMLLLLAWVGGLSMHSSTSLVYSLPFFVVPILTTSSRHVPCWNLLALTPTLLASQWPRWGDSSGHFHALTLSYGVILHSPKNLNREGRHKVCPPVVPKHHCRTLFVPCIYVCETSFHLYQLINPWLCFTQLSLPEG